MSGENISIFLAFAAGVLSFLSPCVLPLVPAYLGHLAGVTVQAKTDSNYNRNIIINRHGAVQRPRAVRAIAVSHALAFVLGFSLVFVTFWVSIGALGYLLPGYIRYVRPLSGLVLIVLGLNMLGVFRIGFLYRTIRLQGKQPDPNSSPGLPASFFTGVVFAVGWTPCIGPVLGGIIGLASESGTVLEGAYLLMAYSLGLGVPFILCALALGQLNGLLRRLNYKLNGTGLVSILSGLFVILVGVLMLTGIFQILPQYFNWLPL